MLEFIFGWLLGVWAAQQLPLPSIQIALQNWWTPPTVEQVSPEDPGDITEEDHENTPIFTGNMPPLTSV
jgi:hypothetical protein